MKDSRETVKIVVQAVIGTLLICLPIALTMYGLAYKNKLAFWLAGIVVGLIAILIVVLLFIGSETVIFENASLDSEVAVFLVVFIFGALGLFAAIYTVIKMFFGIDVAVIVTSIVLAVLVFPFVLGLIMMKSY